MRFKVYAEAQDVHLNFQEVVLEFKATSIIRKGKEGTPDFHKVIVSFQPLPLEMDISDGFNPFDGW